jgi:hypothetical protein
MENPTRRDFILNTLGSTLTFSLVNSLTQAQVLTGNIKPLAHSWVKEMELATSALRDSKIKASEWRQQISVLLDRVDLQDLLRAIDYDRLAKIAVFPEDHESAEELDFTKFKGLPAELSFIPFFYAMNKGVAIVPHGHRNMTSMHMVLKGKAHGWQYDRVEDQPKHLIIKPTIDSPLNPGAVSTISNDRDNIHWFKALDEPVFMFNIGVFALDAKKEFSGRDYIDPMNGEKLADGLIRARRIEKDEAYKLYGKS